MRTAFNIRTRFQDSDSVYGPDRATLLHMGTYACLTNEMGARNTPSILHQILAVALQAPILHQNQLDSAVAHLDQSVFYLIQVHLPACQV